MLIELTGSYLKTIHDRIFSGHGVFDGPFKNGVFEDMSIVIGGHGMEDETFSAIANVALASGDERFVATAGPAIEGCICEWSNNIWEIDYHVYGSVDMRLFGESGKWACASNIEGVGLIAGPKKDIEKYRAELGGDDALRVEFDKNEYAVEGVGEDGSVSRDKIRRQLGWIP